MKALVAALVMLTSDVFASSNSGVIMFACSGNTGRSPMAEYLANYYFAFPTHGYHADSRGVSINPANTSPESNAVTVMKEMRTDISLHTAQQLTSADVENSKLVLTMTKAHKDTILASIDPSAKNVWMLSECADGTQTDVVDAYGKDLEVYRQTRDQIKTYLQMIYDRGGKCYSQIVKK